MKVAQINSVCGKGSTGKICVGISHVLNAHNIENTVLYAIGDSDYVNGVKFSNEKYVKLQALKSRVLGNYGFNSNLATRKLISELDKFQPDIVHIHNIHGHDCNFETLMNYLKEKQVKVVWTFHDCWPFTGYCTYFTMAGCDRWKSKCSECPQYKKNSWFVDRSTENFTRKQRTISGSDLTIVTPSEWLASLVQDSFLKNYSIKVINNGIDLSVFKPTPSDFREKYHCGDKFVLLGVSFEWEIRKGLDVFIKLSEQLPEEFKIILIGTNDKIDSVLPNNIISIHRTDSQKELAELYSSADLLINPTREENFPTVNIESLACGTPVLTFDTGGSAEMIDESCGTSVQSGNFGALKKSIFDIKKNHPFSSDACVARAQKYNMNNRFEDYYDLYEKIVSGEE